MFPRQEKVLPAEQKHYYMLAVQHRWKRFPNLCYTVLGNTYSIRYGREGSEP